MRVRDAKSSRPVEKMPVSQRSLSVVCCIFKQSGDVDTSSRLFYDVGVWTQQHMYHKLIGQVMVALCDCEWSGRGKLDF